MQFRLRARHALAALRGLLTLVPLLALTPAAAETPGQALRYNFDFADFVHWVEDETRDRGIPGAALAIVSREGIHYLHTWGVKEVAQEEVVDFDSVFRIASMSKTFAGTAATLLVNEQLVAWDSPIDELFPGLQIGPGGDSRSITLRQIASHSTGLMPHSYSNLLDDGVEYSRIKGMFPKIPRVCAPGSCYGYQNVVFSLIGDAVEARTGASYAEYIQERLFKPLGMASASVGLESYENNLQSTSPHRKFKSGWRKTTTNPAYYSAAPAAGINASVIDMTQWLRANLGAYPEILSPDFLSEMHEPVIATPYGNYFNRWSGLEKAYYAIGWRVFDYRGQRAIHHGGGVRGFRSEMVFVPEADIGMVLLLNGESRFANEIVPAFLDFLTFAK